MEVDRVLTPIGGTEESLEAAGYAVAIADRYDADLHALHVLSESMAQHIHEEEVEPETVASETEQFMNAVHELARDHDVEMTHSDAYGFLPSQLTHHPGSVILDAAEDVDADFLVIPRESVTGEPREALGKAAEYVLMYASQPVLSV
jgi:nucleotide-binding universal stress UspA family protein